MSDIYIDDQQWEHINWNTTEMLAVGTYENCTFSFCDFSNQNLTNFKFIDCTFNHCNLQLCTIKQTTWNDVYFNECKMIGLRFDECNKMGFSIQLIKCNASYCIFYHTKLIKCKFDHSNLTNADFTLADCSQASFVGCQLVHAQFDQTNLQQADFRHALNYLILPQNNKITKAKFSMDGLIGLLSQYKINVS